MTSSADIRRGGFALMLAVLLAAPVAAAPVPSEVIDAVARERIASRWQVAPEDLRLDWRESPKAVGEDDQVDAVTGGDGGWFVVVVANPTDRFAVRVQATARVQVPVAARPLGGGTRLAAADIRTEERWLVPASGDEGAEIGWEVRRPLSAGDRLTYPAVAPPPVIEPGQRIVAIWERGDVQVRLEGRALQGARAGRPLRVRIDGREGSLIAVAIAPGEVRIQGGTER